jgi:pyridoxamine 5'-phosphate oxidase
MTLNINNKILNKFNDWYQEAIKKESNNPNAMALATASVDGAPSVRIVLMKFFDKKGIVFFTNLKSQKGIEIESNQKVSLCFHWKSMDKQIRIEGIVNPLDSASADTYFASRPRDSQLGAWASKQSQVMEQRKIFELRISYFKKKFQDNVVPRPRFWSGFRISPKKIEFWDEYAFRLHNREVFIIENRKWKMVRLYP